MTQGKESPLLWNFCAAKQKTFWTPCCGTTLSMTIPFLLQKNINWAM